MPRELSLSALVCFRCMGRSVEGKGFTKLGWLWMDRLLFRGWSVGRFGRWLGTQSEGGKGPKSLTGKVARQHLDGARVPQAPTTAPTLASRSTRAASLPLGGDVMGQAPVRISPGRLLYGTGMGSTLHATHHSLNHRMLFPYWIFKHFQSFPLIRRPQQAKV